MPLTFALCMTFACAEIMTTNDVPNPGPDSPDTVYMPGTPGANWSPEEIESTRQRIIQMVSPIWSEKEKMGAFQFQTLLIKPCIQQIKMQELHKARQVKMMEGVKLQKTQS